ncbi:MAG: Rieske 2Fe-2S domain-containing protein [Piscinibacter sp.]|nr:Rieske 2Fe-2S domain-containing protein [Piscinibacter sp.]
MASTTCLHRGTQPVFDSYGSVSGKFTCIYHGWSYSLSAKTSSSPRRRCSSIRTI